MMPRRGMSGVGVYPASFLECLMMSSRVSTSTMIGGFLSPAVNGRSAAVGTSSEPARVVAGIYLLPASSGRLDGCSEPVLPENFAGMSLRMSLWVFVSEPVSCTASG